MDHGLTEQAEKEPACGVEQGAGDEDGAEGAHDLVRAGDVHHPHGGVVRHGLRGLRRCLAR